MVGQCDVPHPRLYEASIHKVLQSYIFKIVLRDLRVGKGPVPWVNMGMPALAALAF